MEIVIAGGVLLALAIGLPFAIVTADKLADGKVDNRFHWRR